MQQVEAAVRAHMKISQDQRWRLFGNGFQDVFRIRKGHTRVAFHLQLDGKEMAGCRVIVDDQQLGLAGLSVSSRHIRYRFQGHH
ncbi:MAG: hypothetical protein Kow0063_37700 [Anaerolineae bacterium]